MLQEEEKKSQMKKCIDRTDKFTGSKKIVALSSPSEMDIILNLMVGGGPAPWVKERNYTLLGPETS